MSTSSLWIIRIALPAAALLCMLGFYSTSGGAPPAGRPPFDDAAAQRNEMIRELRDIKELLKDQTALLKESLKTTHDHESPAEKPRK